MSLSPAAAARETSRRAAVQAHMNMVNNVATQEDVLTLRAWLVVLRFEGKTEFHMSGLVGIADRFARQLGMEV